MNKFIFCICIITGILLATQVSLAQVRPNVDPVNSNLSLGMRGNSVKNLQAFLVEFGYLGLSNKTGYFGQKTLSAVKKFQKAYSLPSTGFVGKLSREKINQILIDSVISYKPVGGDRDAHGCLSGGGYTWSEEYKSCVKSWEKLTNLLSQGHWELVELDSKKTTGISFSIQGGKFNMSGCNGIGGDVEIDETKKQIKTKALISTMMACVDENGNPSEKMNLDTIASSVFTVADIEVLPQNKIRVSNKDHQLVFVHVLP